METSLSALILELSLASDVDWLSVEVLVISFSEEMDSSRLVPDLFTYTPTVTVGDSLMAAQYDVFPFLPTDRTT